MFSLKIYALNSIENHDFIQNIQVAMCILIQNVFLPYR